MLTKRNFLSFTYLLKRNLPFIPFLLNRNQKAKNLIYVYEGFNDISTEFFYKCFFLYLELLKDNGDVGIITKLPANVTNRNIFFYPLNNVKNIKKDLMKNKIADAEQLHYPINCFQCLTKHLESKNNIYPSTSTISFWENKLFMHERFADLNINVPKTIILDNTKNIDFNDLKSELGEKFLFKHPHSAGSSGLIEVSSQEDIEAIIKANSNLHKFIFQKIINMRKDLRVILIDDKIVAHYWRINPHKEWKPTSTSFGSTVDFISFPEAHKKLILDTFKKLKIPQGAFDICWENDDLSNKPFFLEVSPFFQPNPNIDKFGVNLKTNQSYGDWKKTSLWEGSYAWVQRDNLLEFTSNYFKAIKKIK